MTVPDCHLSPLVFRLFGPFDARVNGAPLPRLRSRKGYWLLALLALRHGDEVERSWLAGTLWPDSSEPQALALLRRELTDLRHALGPEAHRLQSPTPHALCLDLAGANVDVVAFDAAIARRDPTSLEEAVALYRGPLLEGCVEEWVLLERQAREERYLTALETLAAQALARGEPAQAERYRRRVVTVDPLRETAQRALMEALRAGGNHAAAAQVYRDLRLLLHRELNAEPAPETRALFQEIRDEARARVAATAHRRPTTDDRPPTADEARAKQVSTAGGGTVVGGRSSVIGAIPRPVTPLVGRENEVRVVKEYLAAPRLVTLTGPGGIGKTRLAIQVAGEMADQYADGTWFVELEALSEPALVAQAVASVLGVQEFPAGRRESEAAERRALIEALREFLRSRELLLVLDNCEHLTEECARLATALLRDCPGLRVLTTSRHVLGVTGETVWRVPPLMAEAAVRLFVERAMAVRADFALTERSAAAAERMCQLLDGIPLAIELAAARANVLTVEQMVPLLDDRFAFLTGGSRTALPRQQTLRATLDWSYELLSEPEQALLRRLSVFAGGWTLEAAEAVCAFGASVEDLGLRIETGPNSSTLNPQPSTLPLEEWQVLDLLSSLVQKSLVVVEAQGEAMRYRLLETIRQYSAERLAEAGLMEAVRGRHSGFFLQLAEEASPKLHGPEQVACIERLEREHDNLRAALDWSLSEPSRQKSGGSRQKTGAMRLARALEPFWRRRGYFTEGRMWITRALHAAGDRFPARRSQLLRCAAGLALPQHDHAAARAYCEESLGICRATGDQRGMALSLGLLGAAAEQVGDYRLARSLHEQRLALQQGIGGQEEIAHALGDLGTLALKEGDLAAARSHFESAVALERKMGRPASVANALLSLGHVARAEGSYAEARACYEESLTLARGLGARAIVGYGVSDLGLLLIRQREYAAARTALEEGLRIWSEIGNKAGAVRCVEGMAQLAWARGEAHLAARLFGAAEASREALQFPLPPVDRTDYDTVPAIAAALGETAFAAAWAAGRAVTLEEAVREAVKDA